MKNIQLDQLCRVSYLDNTLFKPSKIYSNPTMRRFWWWDLLPQSQKFSWQCKVLYYCYFIWRPMLFVEKFQSRWSRCNFLFDSQDWVASKTQLCVRLLRSPSHRPMNPRLDLYIKQAHHCISLYWMGSIFTSAFDQFQIFFWFQKIKRTDCRTHYATIEGRVVK